MALKSHLTALTRKKVMGSEDYKDHVAIWGHCLIGEPRRKKRNSTAILLVSVENVMRFSNRM